MQDAVYYRRQITKRLAEKKKFSSARMGLTWLLMVVSGLVMFTLLRVAVMFANGAVTLPSQLTAIVPVAAGTWYTLRKARHYIRQNELPPAAALVSVAMAIAVFSILLLLAGIHQWSAELKHLPRFTAGSFVVFLLFYTINVTIAIFNLFGIYKKLRSAQIHSMDMERFSKAYRYYTFLTAVYILFIIIAP